jgi:putative intracellular protease/amidase
MRAQTVTVATVCGGSLVLAMAGLLVGRRAVTHQLGMDAGPRIAQAVEAMLEDERRGTVWRDCGGAPLGL